MNLSCAVKILHQHPLFCRQTIQNTHCKMLKSMILTKCVSAYFTRLPSSIVCQFLQKRTKLSHFCSNDQVLQQSRYLHQSKVCINHTNNCHHRRGFSVLKPSRPVISSGYFSENRDGIMKRLHDKNSIRKSVKVSGHVKVDDSSKSAVFLPFCLMGGEPSVLLTLRSVKLNSHRGQVSFPGGRMDKEDRDEIHTALREMEEELGIPPSCADVWGELPPVIDRTSRLIHPVVGFIGDIESLNLKKNPDEVEAAFTMTLSHLCDVRNKKYTLFVRPTYSFRGPVFLGGDHRLWGLSAILLNCALEVILPDDYTPLEESGVMYKSK